MEIKEDDASRKECQRARNLWLTASDALETVEQIYRTVWDNTCDCEAAEKLSLIYLQSGRAGLADAILQQLGYQCRFASHIFNYTTLITNIQAPPHQQEDTQSQALPKNELCRGFNNFLSPSELNGLLQVFANPHSTYWTHQHYTVEPPSPYCSYIIPLADLHTFGTLGQIIHKVQSALSTWQPAIQTQAHSCELWAHNRPHATGHQFHWDSDNEGCGAVRHPIVSAILYLSSTGGPTIVTHQRRASRHVATYGYACLPHVNRCLAFDGRLLHGVIPGHNGSDSQQRRVSVMLAFWKTIAIRSGPAPCAALAWPLAAPEEWAVTLTRTPSNDNDSTIEPPCVPYEPVYLPHIYEDLQGKPWPRRHVVMPAYDEVYQGF
jgi:hypothetical protein